MLLRLIDKLHSHARQRPGDIAIRQIIPGGLQGLTWRELADRVNALADVLSRVLPAGGTVMLCSGNRPEFTAGFLAILAAGMTVFPIAPDSAGPELLSAGERSGTAGLLKIGRAGPPVDSAFAQKESLAMWAEQAVLHLRPSWKTHEADGPALLLLSSGTTGPPKIVRRDGPAIDAVSANMVEAIGFTSADQVLAAVPLCHSYGMEHGLLCPTWAGCTAHLYERFDLPAVLDELDRGAVTVFPGVPFMFETLAATTPDAGGAGLAHIRPLALRRAYSAGGPLPKSLFDLFQQKFCIPIAQLYGATEIGSVTFNDPAIAPFDPGSVGRPMSGVSIRILNPANPLVDAPLPVGSEGHVAIAAPSMLSHYLDADSPALVEGYFLTGDLGRLDASGALAITGRIKLLIDIAGRKVNPLEVEGVLGQHPRVGHCIVVPLRVSPTLCRLKAIVTPARADEPPAPHDLRQFARQRLSGYKVPRVFEVRDSLPLSPTGKVLRHLLESEDPPDTTIASRDSQPRCP